MQEIWEARAHSSLDLVAIRYPLSIYDRCFYLLVVCVLPTSQRPDLPMQSCSTTFLGSSIDSDVMWFKDVAKSRKLNISNGAFCQVASLPKYGEHHLCEPQTCAGWLNVWEEKIWSGNPLPISACSSLFNGFFFEAAGAIAGLGSQPGSRAAHSPAFTNHSWRQRHLRLEQICRDTFASRADADLTWPI